MAVSTGAARAYLGRMVVTTSRASCRMGQLSCSGFYLMDVFLQSVSYLGGMLFTLPCSAVVACISTVVEMTARGVRWCLAV